MQRSETNWRIDASLSSSLLFLSSRAVVLASTHIKPVFARSRPYEGVYYDYEFAILPLLLWNCRRKKNTYIYSNFRPLTCCSLRIIYLKNVHLDQRGRTACCCFVSTAHWVENAKKSGQNKSNWKHIWNRDSNSYSLSHFRLFTNKLLMHYRKIFFSFYTANLNLTGQNEQTKIAIAQRAALKIQYLPINWGIMAIKLNWLHRFMQRVSEKE
jgi:hypothetical protein